MKHAADFRRIARGALRGRWPVAILTGFVASLIGAGITSGGGGGSVSTGSSSSYGMVPDFQFSRFLFTLLTIFVFLAVIWMLVTIVISGAGKLGYATFNLKLVDREEVSFSDLFSQFHRLGAGFCMNFLVGLFTFLWSLLFVIPGIIKAFSYAMTPYILAEHPEMTATEAITESRYIMNGNKWRLFCLGFSFIGWNFLCSLPILISAGITSGIVMTSGNYSAFLWLVPGGILTFVGSLFLMPYQEAAYAAFYRDVSGTEKVASANPWENNVTWDED